MNWHARFSHRLPADDTCDSLSALLSPYADAAVTPEEMRRVEAHLIGCNPCRETLVWIQATRRTLAARPVALPPPDLHSRIAFAIAASESAPLRPLRTFTLRPAYAAAASLTALGVVLSYALRPVAVPTVHPLPVPVQVAVKPPVVMVPPHPVKPHRALVAAKPPAAETRPTVVKQPPAPEQVAEVVHAPVPVKAPHAAPVPVKTVTQKAPVRRLPNPDLVALLPPAERHRPAPTPETPKAPDAIVQVANVPHVPETTVQVHVAPPTVVHDPEPDGMDAVRAKVAALRTAAYSVPPPSYGSVAGGAVQFAHTLDSGRVTTAVDIHSP